MDSLGMLHWQNISLSTATYGKHVLHKQNEHKQTKSETYYQHSQIFKNNKFHNPLQM